MGKCQDCRFFLRYNDVGGECRRFPPQLVAETQMLYDEPRNFASVYFPGVSNGQGCGEFKTHKRRLWRCQKIAADPQAK